jgi:4-hydroxy-tetrahydrodipicolinate reductase
MSSQIPLIIPGANGRMGQTLIRLIAGDTHFKLVGATEKPGSPGLGNDAGVNAGTCELGVSIQEEIQNSKFKIQNDQTMPVMIDFTSPAATLSHIGFAQEHGFALVIGTTGLSDSQLAEVKTASKKIPIVMAPNMSVGMNLLFSLVAEAAQILNDSHDIEIFEAHHRMKKDAPSGSALKIAQTLCEATGRKYPDDVRCQRQGMIGERSHREIGIQTLRGGDIVGDHTVLFCGDGERLEIKHSATSRNTFAMGALKAAAWIVHQKPGLYGMNDVLSVKREV